MRYSKQRETILTALKENPVHPTADHIYAMLKKGNPSLSLGTVYRNLNLLADNGLIKRIKGLDNKEHFDHNTFDHAHIICTKCGHVHDIMLEDSLKQMLNKLKEGSSFTITHCDVVLKGMCNDCK